MLTTEECLLNPNRNPQLSKADVEQYLCEYLGATNILWLGRGIVGDDTDGHIDELARFVNETTVVAPLEEDESDENYAPLRENFDRLKSMRDQDGRPLEVVPLPMPQPMFYDDQRLPACYCNFYIANGVVIVPQYRRPGRRPRARSLALAIPRPRSDRPPRPRARLGPGGVPLHHAARAGVLNGEWGIRNGEWGMRECGPEGQFGRDSLGKTRCFCEVQ